MLYMGEAREAAWRIEMKKQESKKVAPAKPRRARRVGAISARKGVEVNSDHRKESFEYWPRPSELDLAHLAARLARTEKIDPKQLVKEAWEVYRESCRQIQEDHFEVERMLQAQQTQDDERWSEEQSSIPEPPQFPVTFHEMERLLLPKLKGRTGARATVFREYILAELLGRCFAFRPEFRAISYWEFEPDDLAKLRDMLRDDVAKKYGELRKSEYDAKTYGPFATSFLAWYGRWTGHRKSQAKAVNARKGWEKRRALEAAKTGARPKMDELREILESPPTSPLSGA